MTQYRNDLQTIRRRIFNVLPAATFQLHKMLEAVELTLSDLSPTACIECTDRPRLHLNPDFVEKHCRSDEHLFMLIMHELHHLVLGHTRLFGRPDRIANIAFDAVINAMLCHQFPDPAYTSFFTNLNSADEMPGCLLRPPDGWTRFKDSKEADTIDWPRYNRERPHARLVQQLYDEARWRHVTYLEIFEALREAEPHDLEGEAFLIGGHEEDDGRSLRDENALGDSIFETVLRRTVAAWPPPEQRIAGDAATGGEKKAYLLPNVKDNPGRARNALVKLIQRAVAVKKADLSQRLAIEETAQGFETVLPQISDRRIVAYTSLWGHAPIFYRGIRNERRRKRVSIPMCHLYVDISGSMSHYLPKLIGALLRPHREGLVKVFVFSTVVDEVAPRGLTNKGYANTFGTEIDCVFDHFLNIPKKKRPRRMLILTDGFVGSPSKAACTALAMGRIKVYVGLTPDGARDDLQDVATYIETLPLSES